MNSYGSGVAPRNMQEAAGTMAQNQPPRQSQVQEQMSRAARTIQGLTEKIKSLHERLTPVLCEIPEGGNQQGARPALVGHAMALSNQNDQLELLDAALASILDRLEL